MYSSHFTSGKYVLDSKVTDGPPIVYKGVAHKLSGKNQFVFPLLKGSATSYSSLVTDTEPLSENVILGMDTGLVSLIQARNNARVGFTGSVDMFSDDFISKQVPFKGKQVTSGNSEFIKQLSAWVFQEKSVLEFKNARHSRVNETGQHGIYRIKDEMFFSVDIYEKTLSQGLKPAKLVDAQLEVLMLDPYIRVALEPLSNGTHVARFKLPDQYGVFKFYFNYMRHGLSFLSHEETVQVRPFRHDQYPRFLKVATPYYIGSFSMMISFVLLSGVFLFHRQESKKVKKN